MADWYTVKINQSVSQSVNNLSGIQWMLLTWISSINGVCGNTQPTLLNCKLERKLLYFPK